MTQKPSWKSEKHTAWKEEYRNKALVTKAKKQIIRIPGKCHRRADNVDATTFRESASCAAATCGAATAREGFYRRVAESSEAQ